jgi:hypothetical protein
MYLAKSVTLSIVLLTVLVVSSTAQPLLKRHEIGVRMGMWNQVSDSRAEINWEGVSTSVNSSGYLGGLTYSHWLTEGLAVSVSISGMVADIETNVGYLGVTTETAVVVPILFGVKQYFPASTFGTGIRPYAQVSLGPFIGSQSSTKAGLEVVAESRSEAAMGGQLALGADLFLSRRFLFGVSLGYNLMTDFSESIGGSRNYSGPDFGLKFSYLLGRVRTSNGEYE